MTTTRFRLNSKKLFLTYPQSKLSKQEVFDFHVAFKPLERILVAEEEHKDGGNHFHVYLIALARYDIKNPHALDIKGEHGNYVTMKKEYQCLDYCTKFDESPLANFDYKTFLTLNKSKDKVLSNKETTMELLELKPYKMVNTGLISWQQYKKAKEFVEEYEQDKYNADRIEQLEPLGTELENSWNLKLNFNIEEKKCHFWMWSEQPNRGKTTWLLSLNQKYMSSFLNLTEKFQNQLTGMEEILFLDEYRAQLLVSQLNAICDGTYFFPRKSLPAIRLKVKALVIVCSNLPPDKVYPNTWIFIEKRFNIFNID